MELIPSVIREFGTSHRTSDIFSAMLSERVVFCTGPVTDNMADSIVAQLLFLESESANKDIYFYINSPGGSVSAGLAIYDTMNFIKPNIHTIVIGQACSMGAFLLSSGTKGNRKSLPNSRIMIHQPLGGFQGQASDFEIHAKEMMDTKKRLNSIMAKNTGKDIEQLAIDTDRDNFLTAEEALAYGLIDEIITERPR